MESGERFAYRRSNMGRIRMEIWDFMESRCKSNDNGNASNEWNAIFRKCDAGIYMSDIFKNIYNL